eukprot:s2675_g2.t2
MTPQSASTAFTSRQSIARQVRQSAAKTPSHPSDATTPRVVHTTRAVKLFHRSARERHVHFMDIRCRPDLVEMERGAARGPVHSRGNCASFGMQMQVVPQARKLVRGGQKEEALPNPCGPSGGPEGEMEALGHFGGGRYLGHCGARGCRGRTRLPVHDVHGPPASRKGNRPCAARRVGSGATSRGRRVLLEHVHQPDVVGAGAGDRGANPGAGGPGRALVEPAWTGTGTRQTCSGRVLLQFGFQLGRSVSLYVITFGRRLVVEVDVLANLRQMIQNFMKNGKPASLADMLERVTRHIWTHRWKSCCSAASLREWRVKVFFYLHVGPAPPVAEHARPDFAKFSDPAWNPLCQIL